MCPSIRLSSRDLRRTCRPSDLSFETTAQFQARTTPEKVVGQDRAVEALEFGVGIRRQGYNVFAIGPPGVGKQTLLRRMLAEHAEREEVPTDWCYLHNFSAPERPHALSLPAGMGIRLQQEMDDAVESLRLAMRSAFEGEEYRSRKKHSIGQLQELQRQALAKVQTEAKKRDVAVIETDTGIALSPIHDGAPIDAEVFRDLPEAKRDELQAKLEVTRGELHELFHTFQGWGRDLHEALHALEREIAAGAARIVLDAVRANYGEFPAVLAHLAEVERDAIDSADEFLDGDNNGVEGAVRRALHRGQLDGESFRRYRINIIVDRSGQKGAPVVCEDNPTYPNLIGRIENETQFGALITDFTLIRAGALHRAIGGYLLLDALKLLQHPFAWEGLKRALKSAEIKIESVGQILGILPTLSLEPAPIPIGDTKIVLTGDRVLYYLLAALDPDVLEHFKVLVDFEEEMPRDPASHQVYARLVAELVRDEGLRDFDRGAVARVIDHAARIAGDADKLSVRMRDLVALLREADHCSSRQAREIVTAANVQEAIDAQRRRSGRVLQRMQEAILREDILISTSGEAVGQVNGLSVFKLGEYMFGQPSRITARVRLGKGEVIDIEREVEFGGPIHSKGVMILTGFLGARFATDLPLSLSASLVFEQSYASIEGDSASLAELCALLSAIAEVPVRQSLAITGSVNQHGGVQSIGGVNEKIEGFFDICAARGFDGEQGVIIPKSNTKNLMLRDEVVTAVEAGRFGVHAVEHVDQAIELLTGKVAGVRDATGRFPPDSVNGLIAARLAGFAEKARAFAGRTAPEQGTPKER